jgi:Preprotein translocase subunit SecY
MKRSSWRFLWKSEDIRNKLLITLLLLAIYRLAANIPVPGIDRATVAALTNLKGTQGNLINLLDVLSGGAVSNFSILAMGVYPYITAQIILQLLQPIIPALEKKMRDDPREGRIWMEKWTVILTIPMALLSAFGQINIFNQMLGSSIITNWGFTAGKLMPTLTAIFAMVAGTMLGVWIGQLISEFGLRNQGLSLIIFSGIVSRLPQSLLQMISSKESWWMIFNRGHHPGYHHLCDCVCPARSPQCAGDVPRPENRQPHVHAGAQQPAADGEHGWYDTDHFCPVIPDLPGDFGLLLCKFQGSLACQVVELGDQCLRRGSRLVSGDVLYLVVLFTYFYTDVMFTQQNYGDNLKKQGAQIPGVVRGKPTQDYLTRVQRRITLPGAFFLGFVAVMPYLFSAIVPAGSSATLLLSSSGLLIVVGTVRETVQLIETELRMHGYDDRLINN